MDGRGRGLMYYPGIYRERLTKATENFGAFYRCAGRDLEYVSDTKQSATDSTEKCGQY